MFGLLQSDIEIMCNTIKTFTEIECAIIFGSRAVGNYKNGSDVDIAIKGKKVNDELIVKLSGILNEESPLPYFFDILKYESVENSDLKSHIDTYGKIVFSRDG